MSDSARARAMRWVYGTLAASALGFALFPPTAFQIVDESRYVSQAVAFAQGSRVIEGAGFVHPAPHVRMMSDYPPATSLLQAPFVWAFGWRAAGIASLLSLIAATLVTARWLVLHGMDARFALLVPGSSARRSSRASP